MGTDTDTRTFLLCIYIAILMYGWNKIPAHLDQLGTTGVRVIVCDRM